MSHEAQRAAIVEEARSWLRTPWRHEGTIKGVGVDCAMLPLAIAKALGHAPQDFDPRPYPQKWFLHRDQELFLEQLQKYAHRIPEELVEPGDIIMYKIGRTASHAAIVVDDVYMIHAYQEHGQVTLQERRALEHEVHSYWSLFG